MSGLNGDFLGFTFIINGEAYKSQDLGITRVSDGDRYNEPLIPEIEDKTIEIPGLDGTYFYGSDFKTRNFSIKIAFDSMTEENFREMRQVFGYKHMGLLIFDEAPYKQYKVKIASPPELEYVCFDERAKTPSETSADGVRVEDREEVTVEDTYEEEITIKPGEIESYSIEGAPESITVTFNGETVSDTLWDYEDGILNIYGVDIEEDMAVTITYTLSHMEQQITRQKIYPWVYSDGIQRIYKGEGTIEFIAYYPFATQTHKFLDDFDQTNVNEWSAASHLLQNKGVITGLDEIIGNQLIVYNAGDVPTGLMIWIPFGTGTESKEKQHEQSFTAEGQEETYTFIIDDNPETITVLVDDVQLENGDYTYTTGNLSIGNAKLSEGQTVKVQYTVTETNEKKVTDWTSDLKLEYNNYELIISKDIQPQSKNDIGILINTVNGLVEGIRVVAVELDGNINYETSGTVYNRYVRGHFFKIEPNNINTGQIINVPSLPISAEDIHIFYNYLYF